MTVSRGSLGLVLCLAMTGCSAAEATAPAVVGDVGDTSGANSKLKIACDVARDQLISNAEGDRQNAITRGFTWYDAQVPYSQSDSYEGYRTDCSGFVSMCWELGQSYTTADFISDGSDWSSLGSYDELLPADAMVYRSGNSGHIMLFLGWNDTSHNAACVLEQASTAEGMQFRARTTDSLQSGGYQPIRASKFSGLTGGSADPSGNGSGGSGSGGAGGDPGSDPNGGGAGGDPGTGGSGSGGAMCGDGYCDPPEDQNSCPSDCYGSNGTGGGGGSGYAMCGDGYCDPPEDQNSCPSDCYGNSGTGGAGSYVMCGDGYCDPPEDQYSCPSDCGSGGSGSAMCGDGYCDPPETPSSCPYDCW